MRKFKSEWAELHAGADQNVMARKIVDPSLTCNDNHIFNKRNSLFRKSNKLLKIGLCER